MTSTLLDATLCLLLVSAGVVTVTSVGPTEGRAPPASATAETLASATATVNYTLAPGARPVDGAGADVRFPETEGPAFCRTSRGTLAALLADATMGRATIAGRRVTHARDDLAAGVRRAVRAAVGGTHTQVVAVWRPYPDAPVRARTTVGDAPPPRADVRAATVVVSSGAPPRADRDADGAGRGFGDVAASLARRTVRALFPPRALGFALGADYPTSALVRRRYAAAGRALDADVGGAVRRGEVRSANRRLARALAARFERDLRRRYDTPDAAAGAARVGRVRIVVRRWSP